MSYIVIELDNMQATGVFDSSVDACNWSYIEHNEDKSIAIVPCDSVFVFNDFTLTECNLLLSNVTGVKQNIQNLNLIRVMLKAAFDNAQRFPYKSFELENQAAYIEQQGVRGKYSYCEGAFRPCDKKELVYQNSLVIDNEAELQKNYLKILADAKKVTEQKRPSLPQETKSAPQSISQRKSNPIQEKVWEACTNFHEQNKIIPTSKDIIIEGFTAMTIILHLNSWKKVHNL